MKPGRRAVIDVGTNSIKLLVAEVSGREVRPVLEESKQTRLGQGFYETHRLQPESIAATAAAVARFAEAARHSEAGAVRVFATSAARDALNPGDLVAAIQQSAGLAVEIISGEQEADWVFRGVTTDPALAREPLLLLDVGGGSSQFILGRGEHQHFRRSFLIGTVRLLEKFPPGDPPAAAELQACLERLQKFLRREVRPCLEPAMDREAAMFGRDGALKFVGTGGTASILARMEAQLHTYDRERMEATRLSLERIRWHLAHLWSLPLGERRQVVGLPANRADVILMGVAIYEAVMAEFALPELRVSTRGLRFAAVMEPAPTPAA